MSFTPTAPQQASKVPPRSLACDKKSDKIPMPTPQLEIIITPIAVKKEEEGERQHEPPAMTNERT